MLTITRKDGEAIVIEAATYLDSDLPLNEALRDWQIEIVILGRKQDQTKVGIQAPESITVLRKELQQVADTDEAA